MHTFPLEIKSTIDKLLYDTAVVNGYDFFDLDGSYMNTAKAESEVSAITWSLLSLSEYQRDPFWMLQFEVDAKTAKDESQYDSVKIHSIIQSLFAVGKSFFVKDYSGIALPTITTGEILVSASSSSPAAFDRVSGLRPVHITATVQRFP